MITLQCDFSTLKWFDKDFYYSCTVKDQFISEDQEISYIGRNENGKARTDVIAIWFENCKITKVPQKMTEYFPKLRMILINNSNLRYISKNDLTEYKNFTNLSFYNNKIEYLPGDLFQNFKKLEGISFCGNLLRFIEPNILDGLDTLKYVDFGNNPNFHIHFSTNKKHAPNATLQQIKNELTKKFNSRFKLNQNAGNENLKQEVQHLTDRLKNQKINNSKITSQLKQEINDLAIEIRKLKIDVEMKKWENTELRKIVDQADENLKTLGEKSSQESRNSENLSQNHQNTQSSQRNQSNHLLNDLKNLTKDETFKDFKIIIDDREFPVHKFLLAARSPTLAEMLRNNPEAENLKLVDISVETFELILTFFYTDELPNEDGTNYLHLFAAAGRLRIKELKNFAAIKLVGLITEENALEILNLSNKYGHDELRQKAFDEIKKNYPKIEFKDEWIEDGEKLSKFIQAFKVREELMRKADEEFKKLLN